VKNRIDVYCIIPENEDLSEMIRQDRLLTTAELIRKINSFPGWLDMTPAQQRHRAALRYELQKRVGYSPF